MARGKCFFAIDIALDGISGLSTEAIRAIFPRLREFIILVIYDIGKEEKVVGIDDRRGGTRDTMVADGNIRFV